MLPGKEANLAVSGAGDPEIGLPPPVTPWARGLSYREFGRSLGHPDLRAGIPPEVSAQSSIRFLSSSLMSS